MDSLEFSVNETTYSTLLNEKRKSGFEDKSWDEWFKHLFGIKHKSQQEKIENAANKFFYAKNFDQWVKNFAINLNDIWKDDSAKILEPLIFNLSIPYYNPINNTMIDLFADPK